MYLSYRGWGRWAATLTSMSAIVVSKNTFKYQPQIGFFKWLAESLYETVLGQSSGRCKLAEIDTVISADTQSAWGSDCIPMSMLARSRTTSPLI